MKTTDPQEQAPDRSAVFRAKRQAEKHERNHNPTGEEKR